MPTRPSGEPDRAQARAERLAERLASGDRRSIARAISHVEDDTPTGRALLERIFPRGGRARRVGITGPPGSGKSTLVDGICMLLRERGLRVAVLAIDPTSPFTGGAILGDRIRMPRAAGDEGLFVRSMASRGSLGGVSATTYEASEVLDAAGFDWILIETVGVGQSELEIVELADTIVLVLVPESGDAVQVMKAGVMEIADLFVVNKYDREGGDRLLRDIQVTMELTRWARPGGWVPPVATAVASSGTGIGEILGDIDRHQAWLAETAAQLGPQRAAKLRRRMRLLLDRALRQQIWEQAGLEQELEAALGPVAARELSPYRWVARMLAQHTR